MKQYPSFYVAFRGKPFINLLCNSQEEVEQFIVDWCVSNSIRPSADEWAIQPDVPALVSKDIVSEIVADTGGGGVGPQAYAGKVSKWQCIPGVVDVKPNPKMWG